MSKAKAIAYGIGLILAAIGGFLVAAFDGDPKTPVEIGETVDGVKTGIEVIKGEGEEAPEPAPVPADSDVPGTGPETSFVPGGDLVAVASAPEDEGDDDQDESEEEIA